MRLGLTSGYNFLWGWVFLAIFLNSFASDQPTLAVGQSPNFSVAFAPASADSVTGSVSLVSNAPSSPTSIALSGTGVAATFQLTASRTSLRFGNVLVGSISTQSVTLTNTGNSSVTVSQITVSGAGFSISGLTLPLTLTAGQRTTFSVLFAPTVVGSITGSVSMVSNATNSPATITLSGAGHGQPNDWLIHIPPAARHSILEITVNDSGNVSSSTNLTTKEDNSYNVLYAILPFLLGGAHIQTKPETLIASNDVGLNSSLIVVLVPPRTSSVELSAAPTELVKAVDPTTWKVELNFRYHNPPRGLDWLLQQRNVVFRPDEVWLTLPESAVIVDQSKQPSRWEARTKRKYTLVSDDETFVVSWRGGPSRRALIMDSFSNFFLGVLAAFGIGFALYIKSRLRLAMLLAALALVCLAGRLYQASYRPSFPWNDVLPLAATFFGVFLVFTVTSLLIRYRPPPTVAH